MRRSDIGDDLGGLPQLLKAFFKLAADEL